MRSAPIQELHFDISRILHFKEVRFRFGRLPVGYYERLKPTHTTMPADF